MNNAGFSYNTYMYFVTLTPESTPTQPVCHSSSEDKTITDRYQDKLGSNGESCTSTVKSPGTVAHALAPAPWMDSTRFEAFEYKELADVAKKMERIFDDLTGVSPLWFGVEGDETSGSNSFGKGGQRGGNIMFGDWQLDESMLEVFENQIEPTRSNKQVRVDFCLDPSSYVFHIDWIPTSATA